MATSAITAPQTPTIASTTEIQIDESLFTLKNVVTSLFISTITVLTSLLWGIPFGLIGGAASCVMAWVASTSEEQPSTTVPTGSQPTAASIAPVTANLVEELHLDPAQELHPHYEEVPQLEGDAHDRYMRNIFSLMSFAESVHRAIHFQSLHYLSSIDLFTFIQDNFQEMDFSRLTLIGLKPIRRENGAEGYEVLIQSRQSQGWMHLFINSRGSVSALNRESRFAQIPQITPFLERIQLEHNHFSTFVLPFIKRDSLALAVAQDFPNMDLCQVELQSCRPVSFDFHYVPMQGIDPMVTHYGLGFELVFVTPEGTVRYYSDRTGEHIADITEARNVQFLDPSPD